MKKYIPASQDQEELNALISHLRNLTREIEDLQAEAENIKAAMGSEETLLGPDYKVSYKWVEQQRVSTKILSATYPEIARECTRTTTFRRFEVK